MEYTSCVNKDDFIPGRLTSNVKLIGQILLTLNKDGQFFGATWFLGSLFLVSVFYKLLDTYLRDWKYRYSLSFLVLWL